MTLIMSKLLKYISGEDSIGTLSGNNTVSFSKNVRKECVTVDIKRVTAKTRAFVPVETTT